MTKIMIALLGLTLLASCGHTNHHETKSGCAECSKSSASCPECSGKTAHTGCAECSDKAKK